jgi:hypothetical protein
MTDDAPPRSWRRARWAWKLFQASRSEAKGDFERALRLLDEAANIKALLAPERVQRAMLLLRNQRRAEAHRAFAALRDEFNVSDDPDLQYLRHFCTTMLSTLQPGSTQWSYEAKQAQKLKCRPRLRSRFPMVTSDEIWERVQPRSNT